MHHVMTTRTASFMAAFAVGALLLVSLVASTSILALKLRLRESFEKRIAMAAVLSQLILAPVSLALLLILLPEVLLNVKALVSPLSLAVIACCGLVGVFSSILFSDTHHPVEVLGTRILLPTAILVAPVFEESCFRGLLLLGMASFIGWAPAVIVSSFIFTVLHAQALPRKCLPVILVLSLLLSIPPLALSSIVPSMIAHSTANGTSILTGKLLLRAREGVEESVL